MSAMRGNPENICSHLVLLSVTSSRRFRRPPFAAESTTTMPPFGTRPGETSGRLLGCGLRVAVEEVDLRLQHVGEACSSFVDVVVTTAAAEQFGPRCPAGDLEGGRDGRNGVCLGDNEQKGDTHRGSASHWSTPGEAEQRPRGHPVAPYRPILRGHKLRPEWAVRRGADGQVPGRSVTGDVDRLSTEQRTETVKQGQCEDSTTVLERGHHRRGQAVGEGGLGDRCG